MIILSNTGKTFDKIQYSFVIKPLELGIDRNYSTQ